MKNSLIVSVLTLVLAPLALAAGPSASPAASASASPTPSKETTPSVLKDQKDKVSYSIGLDIGTTLKRQMIEVNQELMNRGMQDGLSGNKPLLSEEQVKEVMSTFQKDQMAKQTAARKAAGEKNAEEGKKFLEANKTKEGVKTTASGLQYKVLKEGTGPNPKESDTVKVNYRGTLIDGTEFDSSYKRNQPATFPVNRVIKGWTEGLQLMKVGSKYQFFIPASLAYSERGAGSDIGPNSTLIFDVELLEINPPTPTPPKPIHTMSPPKPGTSPAKPGASPAKPGAAASPGASMSPGKSASPSPSEEEEH